MADAVTPTPDTTATPEAADTTQPPAPETSTDSTADNQTVETPDTETSADNAEAETTPETPDEDSAGTREDDAEGDADDSADDDDQDTDDLDPKVRKALNKANREAKNLRTRLGESKAEAKAANLRADRLEVAVAAGIPADAVEFLQGDSREALESSAEKLLVMMGYDGRVTPPGGPVERGGNPRRGTFTSADGARSNADLDSIGARIYKH